MNIFLIISTISLAVCLIMFFYFKWYIKKRISASALEERSEVEQLIVEINSVTDRNLQLIEDSILRLKKILEETEKRIEEYKNVIEIKTSHDTLYTNLGRGIRSALINPDGKPAPQPQAAPVVQKPASQKSASQKPASESPASQKPLASGKPPKKQIRAAIDSLANEGLPPEEIASRLDISIAQVNLAMNLRRTKR